VNNSAIKWIIGIDEAGRGPLAGPVSVGLVLVPGNFDFQSKLPGLNDSKAISEKKRELLFAAAEELVATKEIFSKVILTSAAKIDKEGIAKVIKNSIAVGLADLCAWGDCNATEVKIYLDGSLSAPVEYPNQETVIKGDSLIPAISLASIMAKVTRDHYMCAIANKEEFRKYDFAKHKGYGTKAHRDVIAKFGATKEHRLTYCQNVLRSV